jgi:hypothetical protein
MNTLLQTGRITRDTFDNGVSFQDGVVVTSVRIDTDVERGIEVGLERPGTAVGR